MASSPVTGQADALSEDPRELMELAALGAALVGKLGQALDVTPEAPLTLTVTLAARKLGVSTGYFKSHVLPDLRVIRRGKRVLVPTSELERWIDRNSARTVGR